MPSKCSGFVACLLPLQPGLDESVKFGGLMVRKSRLVVQTGLVVCRDEGGVFLHVSRGCLGLQKASEAAETPSEVSVP